MINIAFIKFGGLSSGGTEVSFQNVAINLSKKYNVDYLYCDSAPYIGSDWIHPDTDIFRKKIIEKSDVKLKKFVVGYKDVTTRIHKWINTDFWKIFDEKKYDLIFFTNAGAPEYPYTEILDTPFLGVTSLSGTIISPVPISLLTDCDAVTILLIIFASISFIWPEEAISFRCKIHKVSRSSRL